MARNGPGRPPHQDVLTPAEWKVAEWIRHGLTNRRIAERLGVSPDAVKFHVGNALGKLGLSSRAELRLWNGVAHGTALARRRAVMDGEVQGEGTMMLGQVARTTRNTAAAREWYREALGLPELYTFGNLSFFDLGGVRRQIHARAAPDPPPRRRHRGVDGVLRGQRRSSAGADDASAHRRPLIRATRERRRRIGQSLARNAKRDRAVGATMVHPKTGGRGIEGAEGEYLSGCKQAGHTRLT